MLSRPSCSSRVPTKSSTNVMVNLLMTYDERWASKFDRSAGGVFRVVDGRADLDGARPLSGHGDRLVEVGHIDHGEAADDLFRFDERAVSDANLAVLP